MVGEPNSKVKSQKHRPASHCPTSTTRVNLSARETKMNAAQIQQALNQTERSHRTEMCLGSLHRACYHSGWGGRGTAAPSVNVDAGERGCRAWCWTRRRDAARLLRAVCRRGWSDPPHTTPRRLYPQRGPRLSPHHTNTRNGFIVK